MKPARIWQVMAAIVAAIAAVPFFYITLRAAQAPAATWTGLWSGQIPPLIVNTVLYVLLTMLAAGALGTVLAWLVERSNVPGRHLWRWLFALPLAVPAYVCAVCYILLLRRGGMIEQIYMSLTGAPQGAMPVADIYSLGGAVAVTVLCVFPYVFLPVSASLRGANRSLEEAARMLGVSGLRAFLRVTLPLIAPPLFAGMLIVGLYALSDFGTVSMLRYRTFTVAIFNQFAGQVDRASASILSIVLIALTVPLLLGESFFARRGQRMTGNTVVRPIRPRALGAWRWPALALILAVVAAALGVPVLVLGYLSLSGLLAPTAVDRIWSVGGEGVWQHGLNSLWLAAVAASIATTLAVAPAVVATRKPGLRSALLLAVGRSPNALPGIIIGLSLILLFNQLTPVIYGTVLALAIGFAFRLLPQTITTNESALRAVPPNIEQAARTLGASNLKALLRVTVPVALPGISASWMLAFIAAMKELPTAILLRPAGFDTLPVRIWSAASESVYTQAAPPAFLLIVFTMIPLALLYSRRRVSRTVDVQQV